MKITVNFGEASYALPDGTQLAPLTHHISRSRLPDGT